MTVMPGAQGWGGHQGGLLSKRAPHTSNFCLGVVPSNNLFGEKDYPM